MEKVKRNIILLIYSFFILLFVSCDTFSQNYYEGYRNNNLRMILKLNKKFDEEGKQLKYKKELVHNLARLRAYIFLNEAVKITCEQKISKDCSKIISERLVLQNFTILKIFQRDDNDYALVEYQIGELKNCCLKVEDIEIEDNNQIENEK